MCVEPVISLADRMIIIIHPERDEKTWHIQPDGSSEQSQATVEKSVSLVLSLFKKESKEQDRAESLTYNENHSS